MGHYITRRFRRHPSSSGAGVSMSMRHPNTDVSTICKGCTASVHLSADDMETLFGKMNVKEVKVVDESQYEQRILACQGCEAFQFGTTCRWCGCLMHIKAKLQAAYCPAPDGSRW